MSSRLHPTCNSLQLNWRPLPNKPLPSKSLPLGCLSEGSSGRSIRPTCLGQFRTCPCRSLARSVVAVGPSSKSKALLWPPLLWPPLLWPPHFPWCQGTVAKWPGPATAGPTPASDRLEKRRTIGCRRRETSERSNYNRDSVIAYLGRQVSAWELIDALDSRLVAFVSLPAGLRNSQDGLHFDGTDYPVGTAIDR